MKTRILIFLALSTVVSGQEPTEDPYDTLPPPPAGEPSPPPDDKKPPPPKLAKGRFGVNPDFVLSADGLQKISSPRLVWSPTSSYMAFDYRVVEEPEDFSIGYRLMCVKENGKTKRVKKSTIRLNYSRLNVTQPWCKMMFNTSAEERPCFSFFVRIDAEMEAGQVDLSNLRFGAERVCLPKKDRPPRKKVDCDFESGDCDFKNDGCGLTLWKVKESEESARRRRNDFLYFLRRRRSTTSDGPVALTKETTTESCDYHGLCIPCLQSSGFSISSSSLESKESSKCKRSTSSSALYLDPDDTENDLAIGVFNTPSVVYHTSNSIIVFTYEFAAQGMHQIVVGVVCSSSEWVKLKDLEEYKLNNFEISTDSQKGRKCLNLHDYVEEKTCEEFAVQFYGAAAYSEMAVDEVNFFESLDEASCTEQDN